MGRNIKPCFTFVFLFFLGGYGYSQDTLDFNQHALLFMSKNPLTTFNKVEDIPPIFINYLDSIKNKGFQIANPGEEYNSTDLVIYPNKPFRRLCSIFQVDEQWMICYEHGGIGSNVKVIFFKLNNSHIEEFSAFVIYKEIFSQKDLIDFIENKGCQNNYKYLIHQLNNNSLKMNL